MMLTIDTLFKLTNADGAPSNGGRIATRTARHSPQRRMLTFAWKGKAVTIPDTEAAWHFGAYRITEEQITGPDSGEGTMQP